VAAEGLDPELAETISRSPLTGRGDPARHGCCSGATLMGAAYDVVSPYLLLPLVLTREAAVAVC
jgi:hypothetical protein